MKNALSWITLIWILTTCAQAATPKLPNPPNPPEPPPAALTPSVSQAQTAYSAVQLITRNHFKAIPLDEALSARIFDAFIKALDPDKLFFVRADLAQLERFRHRLGDALLDENLAAPFAIFNLATRRAYQRLTYARSLLASGFEFRAREDYRYDRQTAAWPGSEAEMHELWRLRVKNDWLRLKLAGRSEREIVERLDNRYEAALKRLAHLNSEDAFQKFMNAYTMSIEPHSQYLGPPVATEFDLSLRLALVGIGATMSARDDYITVLELAPDGPAARSGQLHLGDRIVGAAQGPTGPMTPIVGWRIDEVAALIRGAADSTVRLELLPADTPTDGPTREISLVRKKIAMTEESARKSIVTVVDGAITRHIGVIALPVFYQDFSARENGDPDYKSATRDVARLIGELKKEAVDGLLIDLRNNGGGSVREAIELTGLFIDQGPVLQELDALGEVRVERDPEAAVAWDGPLGILINDGSASASEVFAAAIQDYQRGVLVGQTSFGKGTIQTLIDLNGFTDPNGPPRGELKLTVAQIFRVNGDSTQQRGVRPDISLPGATTGASHSEAALGNALPWARLKAVDFSPVADLKTLRPLLLARHQARIRKDPGFRWLRQDLANFEEWRSKNRVSLNEAERRREDQALLAWRRSAGEGQTPESPLADDGLLADERKLADQQKLENEKPRDLWLSEAAHIVSDEAGLLNAREELAKIAGRRPAQSADQVHAGRSAVL